MTKLNEIIINKSVIVYSKVWNYQNDISHTLKKYRQYAVEWYKKLIKRIEIGNKPEMTKYLRVYPFEIRKYTNSCIRRWNIAA